MAARFIGLQVRVTLTNPKGEQVRGAVKEVGAGSQLTLSKAQFYKQGRLVGNVGDVVIPVNRIEDVVIEDDVKGTGIGRKEEAHVGGEHIGEQRGDVGNGENRAGERNGRILEQKVERKLEQEVVQEGQRKTGLRPNVIDPAIVTFERKGDNYEGLGKSVGERGGGDARDGRNRTNGRAESMVSEQWVKAMNEPKSVISHHEDMPEYTDTTPLPPGIPHRLSNEPEQKLRNVLPVTDLDQSSVTKSNMGSQPKQDTRSGIAEPTTATLTEPFSQIALDPIKKDDLPTPVRKEFLEPKQRGLRGTRGKGRKYQNKKNADFTPTQPYLAPEPSVSQSKVSKRTRQKARYQDQSGWATGDATDIQDKGDFDFEENLSKFDKRKIFDEIRQGDTTADEDRLHTFNRKPGTAGGKNLHYTENVLDSPKQIAAENSSADDEIDLSSTRRGSDRSIRKNLSRKVLSRAGSNLASTETHMTGSGSLPDILETLPMERVSSSRSAMRTPQARSRKSSAQYPLKSQLRYAGTNRLCPCLTPLQMLELEQFAIAEYEFTEDMITENAARSIADASTALIQLEANTQPVPLIVVLVGNTKTGARAIAAARHLRNRRARVVLCILGLGQEDRLLESVRRQLNIYRLGDGRAIEPKQLQKTLRLLGNELVLILDAMLSIHLSYDDLSDEDQASFQGLLVWIHDQETAKLLAIDVPSGVDGATGATSESMYTSCVDEVLCLGAPKAGMVAAMGSGEFYQSTGSLKGHLRVRVADIGIPNAVWKRYGKKGGRGIEFGGSSNVEVEYVGR